MPAATAEGPARGTGTRPHEGAGPSIPPPVATRVAAELARPGEGLVTVAGDASAAVAEALPENVRLVGAEVATLPSGPGATAPHTALLVLDDAADGAALERRLGAACRRFPGRLLVWQRDRIADGAGEPGSERDAGAADPVPVERFFAFGFRRAFVAVEGGVRHALHEYRLADYKQPPDWLNARYWANPERFDADPDVEPAPAASPAPEGGTDDARP